jgi:hypothetical protein
VEVKYKIVVDELETTSQKNIFAIGDCALKRAELTPIAIQAGTCRPPCACLLGRVVLVSLVGPLSAARCC